MPIGIDIGSLVVKSDLTRNYQWPFMPPASKKLGAILLLGCQSVCPFVTLFSIPYRKKRLCQNFNISYGAKSS